MSYNAATGIYVGNGSIATGYAATSLTLSKNSGGFPGCLLIAVIGLVVGAGCTEIFDDGGYGWKLLRRGTSGTQSFAVLAAIQRDNGTAAGTVTFFGVNTGGLMGNVCTFIPPLLGTSSRYTHAYEIPTAIDLNAYTLVSGASTTLTVNQAPMPYAQCLEIACGSYKNPGAALTIGVVGAGDGATFTERLDTADTTIATNIFLDSRLTYGPKSFASANATVSAATASLKFGTRLFFPIVGNTMAGSRRWMQSRRIA